jgi:hypothetical protein
VLQPARQFGSGSGVVGIQGREGSSAKLVDIVVPELIMDRREYGREMDTIGRAVQTGRSVGAGPRAGIEGDGERGTETF